MYALLLVIHVLVAILLITVILIQRGRGGGLVESFSGMESMFGTKTSEFLTRTTAILATLFLFTSITLALIAARQTRSLIKDEPIAIQEEAQDQQPVEEMPMAVNQAQIKASDQQADVNKSPDLGKAEGKDSTADKEVPIESGE